MDMLRSRLLFLLALQGFVTPTLFSVPANTQIFCQLVPDSKLCFNARTSCELCHSAAPMLNPYGAGLARQLKTYPGFDASPDSFRQYLGEAVDALNWAVERRPI